MPPHERRPPMAIEVDAINKKITLWLGIIAAVFAIYLLSPFAVVTTGHRGVITTFGKPASEAVGEGLHFVMPFVQKMNLVNVAIARADSTGEAASKDLQVVHVTITLNYHAMPDAAVNIFRDLGNAPETRIIQPATQEAVKAITAQFTAEELISKREVVRNSIMQALATPLTRHGIAIDEMSITNFSFSRTFNDAIEAKTTAEQLKLKAERDLERVKVEANQRVAAAEGEARALAAQKQQITAELLQLRTIENERFAIEKWDGHMPTYMTSGAPLPFVHVAK